MSQAELFLKNGGQSRPKQFVLVAASDNVPEIVNVQRVLDVDGLPGSQLLS